ncbi:MAG: helix-turn-helix domain-containing protein [Atopobiaceae bacterium]|nr:helix-turn-helix domain-containing protein [Atopobiaceae bacterium]
MHNAQEHGAAKRLTSDGDKTAAQQYDELRRGELFYTIKEVVATGLCSRQTLWRLMKAGELGHVNVGTRVLIPREELLDYVRRNYHKGKIA